MQTNAQNLHRIGGQFSRSRSLPSVRFNKLQAPQPIFTAGISEIRFSRVHFSRSGVLRTKSFNNARAVPFRSLAMRAAYGIQFNPNSGLFTWIKAHKAELREYEQMQDRKTAKGRNKAQDFPGFEKDMPREESATINDRKSRAIQSRKASCRGTQKEDRGCLKRKEKAARNDEAPCGI